MSENTPQVQSKLANFGDKIQPPWPKGVSPNPGGRPKAVLPRRARRALKRVIGKDDNGEPILAADPILADAMRYARDKDGLGHLEFLLKADTAGLAKDGPTAVASVSVQLPDWYLQDRLHPEEIKP